jgi:hypothetical protein
MVSDGTDHGAMTKQEVRADEGAKKNGIEDKKSSTSISLPT